MHTTALIYDIECDLCKREALCLCVARGGLRDWAICVDCGKFLAEEIVQQFPKTTDEEK